MRYPRWSRLLLVALVLALSSPAYAQTTYRLTRLDVQVTDINENGEMVGATRAFAGPPRAILLRDGIVTELGDLAGGARLVSAVATAINDLTQITGANQFEHDNTGCCRDRGFLWEGGQIRDLGVDPRPLPLDINNQGQIVGQVSPVDVGNTVPFIWQAGRTTILETLFCPGNLGGAAFAINNNGVIVGSSRSSVGSRAVIWKDGGLGGITSLEPPFELEFGDAVDVNDRGEVIGNYRNAVDPNTNGFVNAALLWQGDEVTMLLPLDLAGALAAVVSINNQGEIVGSTFFVGSGPAIATLWQDGAAFDLTELVSDDDPAKAFVTLENSIDINDAGLIIALGTDSRDVPNFGAYYLLTPTGVPASSAATPPPAASSPPPDDNGGGALDRVSLLLLVIVLSASAACVRRRQRALAARRFG